MNTKPAMDIADTLIALERRRFLESTLYAVHVKTWPWVAEREYGVLALEPLLTGRPLVVIKMNGIEERFADLDELLQRWMGD